MPASAASGRRRIRFSSPIRRGRSTRTRATAGTAARSPRTRRCRSSTPESRSSRASSTGGRSASGTRPARRRRGASRLALASGRWARTIGEANGSARPARPTGAALPLPWLRKTFTLAAQARARDGPCRRDGLFRVVRQWAKGRRRRARPGGQRLLQTGALSHLRHRQVSGRGQELRRAVARSRVVLPATSPA